jgi:hypothetical protein
MSDQIRGPEGRWPEPETPQRRDEELPEHEIDTATSVGGGVMAAGGTAQNRTAGAPAQPAPGEDDREGQEGPPAHLDADDQPVLDEPEKWVFGGRSG